VKASLSRDILNGHYLSSSSFVHSSIAPAPALPPLFSTANTIDSRWQTDVSRITSFSLVFPTPRSPASKLFGPVTDAWIVNEQRTVRVADLLSDFRTLQYWIAAAPVDPEDQDDYYTEGWAALRQCSIDGQHILNCAAETRVPRVRGGPEEQEKAELQQ
jgi:hypothetical protein